MLMGFTVLQKTEGSFSFGPAFVKDLNMKKDDIEKGAKDLGKIPMKFERISLIQISRDSCHC